MKGDKRRAARTWHQEMKEDKTRQETRHKYETVKTATRRTQSQEPRARVSSKSM